jgi:hypothetical protein
MEVSFSLSEVVLMTKFGKSGAIRLSGLGYRIILFSQV